jgi:hypothetical protein
MAIASFSFAVRAPHPAATGGGFGLAPWENPGPRPPKAGAALSPTGQGKFRRDDQPSLRYGSAGQGCLVQKLVVEIFVHRSLSVDRIYGVRFIKPSASSGNPGFVGSATVPVAVFGVAPKTVSQTKWFNQRFGRDARVCTRDACAPPDDFIGSRFLFIFQNVIFHSHFS